MRFIIDHEGEDFVFENDWDTVIPVSYTTIGGETTVTVYPSIEQDIRRLFCDEIRDPYGKEDMKKLFSVLLPYMEKWGYADDRFRDRWGYIYKGCESSLEPEDARLLTKSDERRNQTTYDIAESLNDGRLAVGIVRNGRVVSLAVTHEALFSDMDEVEVGVETVKSERGHGYAARCLAKMILELKKRNITTVYRCQRYNTASRRVAEKAGLTEVGRFYYYVGRKKNGV